MSYSSRNQKNLFGHNFPHFLRKDISIWKKKTEDLANIFEDYGSNMKNIRNGEEYTESSMKCMWNTVAQMLQEKYVDLFQDMILFRSVR